MASTMTDVKAWNGTETLVPWLDFYGEDSAGTDTVYRWASVPLADPSTYNGGFKDARVIDFGEILMSLSDANGQMTINGCALSLSDLPDASGNMLLRGFLGNVFQLGISRALMAIRLVTDTDRRASTAPLTVFRGIARKPKGRDPYIFDLEGQDWFGQKVDKKIAPPVVTATDFPTAPARSLGRTIPIIAGAPSDESSANPRGTVPIIPGGTVVALDSSVWQRFIVACHAMVGVTAGYITTSATNYGTITWDSSAWMKPGDSGYAALFGADPFYDGPSGQRYYCVYGTDDIGIDVTPRLVSTYGATMTLNVEGAEDVGDGSGALIESIYDIIAWLFDNFIGPETPWAGGSWLGIPTWDDGTDKRNAASFATAATNAATLIPSGNTGEYVIGAPKNARDVLAELAISGFCDLSTTADGQFAIYVGNPASITATLTESDHILAGSFRWEDDDDALFNAASVGYAPRYLASYLPEDQLTIEAVTTATIEQEDALSQEIYARRAVADQIALVGRRDPIQAADVLRNRLMRSIVPPRTVSFDIGIHHLLSDGLKVGDMVAVTHRQGPGATGYSAKSMQVRQMRVSLDEMKVSLTCQDFTVLTTADEAFDASHYTGTGAGSPSWTVGSTDVDFFTYRLLDTQMQVRVRLSETRVGNTTNNLHMRLPGGKTAAETISFQAVMTNGLDAVIVDPPDNTGSPSSFKMSVGQRVQITNTAGVFAVASTQELLTDDDNGRMMLAVSPSGGVTNMTLTDGFLVLTWDVTIVSESIIPITVTITSGNNYAVITRTDAGNFPSSADGLFGNHDLGLELEFQLQVS